LCETRKLLTWQTNTSSPLYCFSPPLLFGLPSRWLPRNVTEIISFYFKFIYPFWCSVDRRYFKVINWKNDEIRR
jgi:hypothetical protein